MIKIIVSCLFLALVSASDVLELTDADFDDQIAGHDIILVEFFAPWCGHCKRLAPEYERAATALKENDPPVSLAKVDCTVQTGVCGKHGVSGYPTLKIFRKGGSPDDYNGPRDADGIIKYMRSKAGPTSKELKSVADVEKFLNNFEIGVVGFFVSSGSEIQKAFQKLADSLSEDFRFAHTFDKAALEKFGYSDDVVVVRPKRLANKFEDSQVKYDGEAVLAKLKTWVNDNVHGLVGHRTSGNNNQFKRPLVTAYYDVDYIKNAKGTNYWRNRVLKVAKKLTEAGRVVNFAVASRDEFNQELSEFGLDSPSEKPIIAAKDSSEQKFVMSTEFSVDNLEEFVGKFLDGEVDAYLKSEAVPEPNDEPVKVVVAKNFDEIVNDETKDVLIEFYAPWCGHCKTLAPKYDELAKKLEAEEDIVIAKMDATANDVPKPYDVRGFPTLFFVPKNSKKSPKAYQGDREVKDFIKYIAREATDPLTGYDRTGKKVKSKTEL